MKTIVVRCALCLLVLPVLVGCQSTNRSFRDGKPPNTVSSLALPPSLPAAASPKAPCDEAKHTVRGKPDKSGSGASYQDAVATEKHPCIAFLEFDDMGEPLDRGKNHQPGVADQWGASHELDAALHLVEDTRNYSEQNQLPAPIIVVFVHGWKHNAGDDDDNVKGFEEVIRYLSGQQSTALSEPECQPGMISPVFPQRCVYAKHPVIGIYIGWRGDRFNKHFPVSQDLSYFDREAAGERTGTTSLTHALISINAAAKRKSGDPNSPFLMLIGHSFGGLVLERAVSQAFLSELDLHSQEGQFAPFADLIVYANTAAAATFSKPTVDILAQRKASYEGGTVATSFAKLPHDESTAQPLILSVSTPADAATSIILPIGQSIGSVPKHLMGSFTHEDPLACFDPYHTAPTDLAFDQSSFYTHSAPHLEQLRSHDVIELVDAQKKPLTTCPTLPPPGTSKVFGSVPGRCFALVDHPNRCNGTPYWILRTDKAILPDHGTIFTVRFISFLVNFFPQAPDMAAPGTLTPFARPQFNVQTAAPLPSEK